MSGKIGATIGMFDGVHRGHQHLIKQLRESCGTPYVVTFANHPLAVINPEKAPRLLTTPAEKEALLRGMGVTPVILDFDESLRRLTAAEFVNMLAEEYGVSNIVLGFNNSIGSDRCTTSDDIKRLTDATGAAVTRATELDDKTHVNSSAIRQKLSEGDIDDANAMLGHEYTLAGTVVHGKALGRKLGFPTANLHVGNPAKLIPATGVYAADAVTSAGDSYRAVVNIGRRPTVDNPDAPITIEAFLDGFSGNLYDSSLSLRFLRHLRSEQHFPSIDTLREAIAADIAAAREMPGMHSKGVVYTFRPFQ